MSELRNVIGQLWIGLYRVIDTVVCQQVWSQSTLFVYLSTLYKVTQTFAASLIVLKDDEGQSLNHFTRQIHCADLECLQNSCIIEVSANEI